MSTIAPDQLFVIGCPTCGGHVAATGGMCGRDACCPLCASLFHVPTLTLAGAVVPPSPTPPPPAEDWGNVIETLAPPIEKPAAEPAFEHPSDFEIPPEGACEPAVASAPAPVVEPSLRDMPDAAAGPVGSADGVGHTPDLASPLPIASQLPSADWIDEVLATPSTDETYEASAAPEGLPHVGPSQLAPADQELEFREPVRTVRHGDTVVEIRRLTPEERRARRFRRNVMMIVIGVSILLAIVVIFGVPTKPPR